MDFRLLGAVEAWSRQQRIDLGPPKQRFLLAVLALKINQLVSVDRLVDLTWPLAPPPTAHHAIHVRISQLRATIARQNGDGRAIKILTRGSAYVLQADPMCVDTHRFRALICEARARVGDEAKVSLYRRAIGLWQGPPLADVATPDIVDQLCAGLEETRLIALEECLDVELRLGRHRVVVDELADLVAQHPYRQQLLAKLMLALYRAGRAPEALRAYKIARVRLIEELGLEPDPALRQLEQAILRTDPALDVAAGPEVPAPRVATTAQPAVEVELLSRRFGAMTALNDIGFSVQPRDIVGVLGPAGSGKTTLIRLLGTLLAPSGGTFTIAGVPAGRPSDIRRLVGLLPAFANHPGHQTGFDVLTYYARLFGVDRAAAPRLVDRLLAEVGLSAQASMRISSYGKELRRRLELARSLVHEPSVLLLDEPTTGLNPLARHRMLDLVRQIASQRGATVLFTTEDLAEVQRVCGSVLILDRGVTVAFGPLSEVTGDLARANP